MNSVPAKPVRNPVAIMSLICGVAGWIVIPFLGAIAAVVCGNIARREIHRAAPGTMTGSGLALTGLVLGWGQLVMIVITVVGLLTGLIEIHH